MVRLLVGAGRAGAAPTFAPADYPSLANSNVVADFSGDGRLELAGIGFRSAAVLLATGQGFKSSVTERDQAVGVLVVVGQC